jgi:hypothetical protein
MWEMYYRQVVFVNDCAQGWKALKGVLSSEELHDLRECASSVERALVRHLERMSAMVYWAV